MDNRLHEILDDISGFHIYNLSDMCICEYVSESLCEMTGYSRDELLASAEGNDCLSGYEKLVHVADRQVFDEFIERLKNGTGKQEAEYRIIGKSGNIMWVRDSAAPKMTDDSGMVAYSVLTDITELKKNNDNLTFLNETIPCGFLKYTCEKQPKVTYVNNQMLEMLRFPQVKNGELDYLEMYKNNVFLMIPMEERRRFSLYLNRVYSAGTPIAGEMTVLRCDGTRAHVFGWVTKCVNENGLEEFQSVCMDITERYQVKKSNEVKRYIKALSDVYDKIFEYNLGTNTVKCLYSNNSPMFKWLENVSMQMEDATENWISDTVDESDKDRVRKFFKDFSQKNLITEDGRPSLITYSAKSSDGSMKNYSGIFLKMDGDISQYCCRRLEDDTVLAVLKDENTHLKEDMQEIMTHFTDGAAAFKVTADGYVMPMYSSDNVCEFFGYSKNEWQALMLDGTSIESFVAHCDTDYEKFEKLLRDGEAEFAYHDIKAGETKSIRAICSQKELDSGSSRYIMLYTCNNGESDGDAGVAGTQSNIAIRTFGYFDVFVGDKPIAFRNKKSKELFALLVDRRGGYVTSEEAIGFLWEDETVNPVTLARYRKTALRLKNTLEEYGITDVVESVDGKRRIVTEKVRCDLYDYLSGKEQYAQLFKGSYLTNYSWAETTLGELSGEQY